MKIRPPIQTTAETACMTRQDHKTKSTVSLWQSVKRIYLKFNGHATLCALCASFVSSVFQTAGETRRTQRKRLLQKISHFEIVSPEKLGGIHLLPPLLL